MRKLFSGLFLFFMTTGIALASSFGTSGLPAPVSSGSDLSVAYLAQIFGTVGNTLQGTSGQMLGMLFSKLNEGILIVAGLWLIYTVVTIVLRSAMDGSFMGPNKNVFWIIIRIAIAFAMLIPGPMTGYNIIQDVVMKIVVEGVSLADQTWNYGLAYIGSGGTLWHRPEATRGGKGSSGSIVSKKQAKTIFKPSKTIFLNEVCMVKSSTIKQNQSSNSASGGVANTSSAPVHYNVVANNKTHTFYFPGVGNQANYASDLSSNTPGNANCGYVRWSSVPHVKCSSKDSASCLLSKAAVSQMVYDLLPAAKRYVCSQGGGGSECIGSNSSNIGNANANAFFNTLVNYVNAVMPIAQSQSEGAAKVAKDFIPAAMKEGWMMAGRYYWDLSQIQAYYGTVSNIAKYIPQNIKDSSDAQKANTEVDKTVKAAKTQIPLYLKGSKHEHVQGAYNKLAAYKHASGAGDTGAQYPSVAHSAGNWVLNMLLGPVVGDIVGLFALFSTHGGPLGMGPDPIMFLHNVGMHCISIAGDIWIGLGLLIFGAAAATMVCQGSLNLSTPLNEIVGWLKPPLMILAAALLGVGVLLGYYVPLYPFILFTFGVIGWLISVIEAMVAAPLIAFGLTHPEGHDFLGEAKQGLTLLLGVFLRPVLMVVGLIAGMILSYVSLRILVYTYSGILQDIFYQIAPIPGSSSSVIAGAAAATGNVALGSSGSGLIMSLFCFPLMLAIFAALVYVVTTQCFSLIYVLPDYILRWIGGPTQPSTGADMARQVQGVVSQAASTGGDMAGKGLQAKDDQNTQKESRGEGAADQGSTTEHPTTPAD